MAKRKPAGEPVEGSDRIAPHCYTEADDDAGIRCGASRLRFLFIAGDKDIDKGAHRYVDAGEENHLTAAMELEQAAIVFVEELAEARRMANPLEAVLVDLAGRDDDPMSAAARRTLRRIATHRAARR